MLMLHTYNLVGKTSILSCTHTQCVVFFCICQKENSFLLFIIASIIIIIIIIVYDESLLEKILIADGGTVHPQATIEKYKCATRLDVVKLLISNSLIIIAHSILYGAT